MIQTPETDCKIILAVLQPLQEAIQAQAAFAALGSWVCPTVT